MFSHRSAWDRAANAYAAQLERARADGRPLIDLTISNPTEVGLGAPWDRIAEALADPRGATYAPEPLGLRVAREAVAAYYRARGVRVDPSQVVITASTSEAYAFLFKLLADPGDAILVPQPGYPLLDMLAELEPIELRPYRLDYHGAWYLDIASIGAGARALVAISPHNPTGHVILDDEREKLGALGLPLIVDEVFADYAPGHRSMADHAASLTFTLSGLSKVAAMPQLKLGWMVVSGPGCEEALARLELIADSFLSVATPVQLALPKLLALADEVQPRIRERLRKNLEALRRARPADAVWDIVGGDRGWYALLAVPRARSLDAWCAALLDAGVIVQPGHLFDLEAPHALVLSLLPREDDFARGAEVIAKVIR